MFNAENKINEAVELTMELVAGVERLESLADLSTGAPEAEKATYTDAGKAVLASMSSSITKLDPVLAELYEHEDGNAAAVAVKRVTERTRAEGKGHYLLAVYEVLQMGGIL